MKKNFRRIGGKIFFQLLSFYKILNFECSILNVNPSGLESILPDFFSTLLSLFICTHDVLPEYFGELLSCYVCHFLVLIQESNQRKSSTHKDAYSQTCRTADVCIHAVRAQPTTLISNRRTIEWFTVDWPLARIIEPL